MTRRKSTQTSYDDRRTHSRHVFAWVIVALAALAVIAFVTSLAMHAYYPTMMPTYSYPWFGWWFFPFGFIFFIFFVFFIFRVAFWGMGGWGWRRGYYYQGGDAREIARQRYARGEITKEQFDQMMRDLEQR